LKYQSYDTLIVYLMNRIINNKESKHYVYLIRASARCNTLIKYNIFTKRKYVVLRTKRIYDYDVNESNLVIYFEDYSSRKFLFWNNKIHKLIPFLNHNNCGKVNLIYTENKQYTIVYGSCRGNLHIYDINDFIGTEQYVWIRISNDGTKVMKCDKYPDVYIHNINNMSSIFSSSKPDIILGHTYSETWIYSNYLVGFEQSHNGVVCNINTNKKLILNHSLIFCIIFIVDNLLIINNSSEIWSLYDIATLDFLVTISFNIKIIGTNNLLNVLIDEDFQCYKITSDLRFEKINIGLNYMIDYNYVSNQIKIIMNFMADFIELPFEILFIELYQCMINLFIE